MKKLTTEELIKKAKAVHGNKYDYSKVEYVDGKTKVCIICPEHGEFWQTPSAHIRQKQECPKCAKTNRLVTTNKKGLEKFIKDARKVHSNKYDYSKVVYNGINRNVCIICPEHGEFWQTPYNHTSKKCECPKCSGNARLTTEEFISRAKAVHGDKYNYSKVEFTSVNKKVRIICPEHGEFRIRASHFLAGHGCPKCAGNAKLMTEDFIRRAKEIHGDKYDYSKVEFASTKKKVCIICPKHGEFWQRLGDHLNGKGCPKCAGNMQSDTENFIRRAKEIHGDRYDYSKVEYVNANTKVCIICPEHGEFWTLPHNHLKCECPKCVRIKQSDSKKMGVDEFIRRAKEIHGDKYDYSKVEYVNNRTKVCIICPKHGEFWQIPHVHIGNVSGCPKCAKEKQVSRLTSTTEEFIRRAKGIHGDKYDYSKAEYVNNHTKVCIICPEHGEFWQTPNVHINRGDGCPKCAVYKRGTKSKLNTEDFIRRAKEIHGDKYDYSKAEYNGINEKVCIICPEHGEFWQDAKGHLNGSGCPICNLGFTKQYKFNLLHEFESEYELRAFLENNDVNILYVILRNVEPKFEPIKADIEKALKNIELKDPIQALEEKYAKGDEEETEETINDSKEEEVSTVDITNVDLDDDDAVNDVIGTDETEDEEDTNTEPTIEDVVKNTEKELEVISKIEHMLTPEDREYIMEKFLNDKLRDWMANRETSSN